MRASLTRGRHALARFGERDAHGTAATKSLFQDNELRVRKVEELPAREPRESGQARVGQDVTNKGLVATDHQSVRG